MSKIKRIQENGKLTGRDGEKKGDSRKKRKGNQRAKYGVRKGRLGRGRVQLVIKITSFTSFHFFSSYPFPPHRLPSHYGIPVASFESLHMPDNQPNVPGLFPSFFQRIQCTVEPVCSECMYVELSELHIFFSSRFSSIQDSSSPNFSLPYKLCLNPELSLMFSEVDTWFQPIRQLLEWKRINRVFLIVLE